MNQPMPRSTPQSQAMTWPCWRLILLLMATCFMAHFNRIGMSVAYLRGISGEYPEISTTQIGWVYSAFLWAYTLFMIPGGWLIDRKGPRLSLLVVGIGSAIFAFLTGCVGLVATSATMAFIGFLVIRSLMGILSAPLHPSAARAVSLGIPVMRRTVANGLVTGAALLGIAATYVGFPLLIQRFTWPGAFIAAALVTLVIAVIWRLFAGKEMTYVPDHRAEVRPVVSPPSRKSDVSAPAFLRRNKNLLLLTVSYAAYGYFQYLFFYWLEFYFEKVLGWEKVESQNYCCIPILAMAVGMPFGGWLSDRLIPRLGWRAGRAHLAIFGMTASAALLFFGSRATDTFWIVTMLSLSLGIIGMLEGSFWVTAIEVGGHRGGFTAGVLNTGGNIGGAIQNVLTPYVSDHLGYGWNAGITLGSIVCLMGGILWFWIDDPQASPIKAIPETPIAEPSASLAEAAAANQVLRNTPFLPNPA